MKKLKASLLVVLTLLGFSLLAQNDKGMVIDEVIAVVGKNFILHSDIESQYLQVKMQYGLAEGGFPLRCNLLENMMFQKLLVNQAMVDSVIVTEAQVDERIERNLRYFISQFGSRAKLEEYYKKSFSEIKEELKDPVKDQLLSEIMQERITQNVVVTPGEVKAYFEEIPVDSLPLIPAEYELQEIVKIPQITEKETMDARARLNGFRDRILKGESFTTLAVLYSEDPGSMTKGGELGFFARGDMYPEFEAAAFSLKPGEISPIVKTKAGFHILQLIERRGEMINVRHLLIQPKPSTQTIMEAKLLLDSVYTLILENKMTVDSAAKVFSDYPSKNSGGTMINPYTGTALFEAEHLDKSLIFAVERLKMGEISKPLPMSTDEGKNAYRLVYLKNIRPPHKANMRDDYDKIQRAALENKKAEVIEKWMNDKIKNTYIKIKAPYDACDFDNKWIK
jgi:peptidyl-prolyl cis-trans isomerase SurA